MSIDQAAMNFINQHNALKIAKSDNKISWDIKQKRVFDDKTPWVSDIQKTKKMII